MNKRLLFLLKFGKKEYIENLVNKGDLYFSPAERFSSDSSLGSDIYDKWDSYKSEYVTSMYIAPLLKDDETGIEYGEVQEVKYNNFLHLQPNYNKKIPVYCLQIVEELPPNRVLKIEADIIAKMKESMDVDYFALILYPKEFLDRLKQIKPKLFRHSIFYERTEEYEEFVYGRDDPEYEKKFPYTQMFYKDKRFAYQNELRCILPQEQWSESKIINIGSIKDLCILGDIEQLQKGILFQSE